MIAVLDWELSTTGQPLADLAYFLMPHYWPTSLNIISTMGSLKGVEGNVIKQIITQNSVTSLTNSSNRWISLSKNTCVNVDTVFVKSIVFVSFSRQPMRRYPNCG